MKNLVIFALLILGIILSAGCTQQPSTTQGTATPAATETASTPAQTPAATSAGTGAFEKDLAPIRESIDKEYAQFGEDVEKARKALSDLCDRNKDSAELAIALAGENSPDMAEKGVSTLGDLIEKPGVKPEVIDGILKACDHPSDSIREKALSEIRFSTDEVRKSDKAIAKFMEKAKDKSGLVRYGALSGLDSEYAKDDVKKLFLEALKDEADQVRGQALYAIGNENDKTAVDAVKPLLADKSAYVRCYAALALGKIKNKDAMKDVAKLLDDKAETFFSVKFENGTPYSFNAAEKTVAEAAAAAFEYFSGEKFEKKDKDRTVKDVEKCREWVKKNVR